MVSGERFTFIARLPDQPGALMRAAEAIVAYGGNIVRLHHDHRIDPATVFFEVEVGREGYEGIRRRLEEMGYLQQSLAPHAVLKFFVRLPHRTGALLEFLRHTSEERANITLVDFDESGAHPDQLKVSLSLEESGRAERLIDRLKSRYPLEIIEYDPLGLSLDETVFYIRFAQELRALLAEPEEELILAMLHDVNHIVQELNNRGEEPRKVFQSVLETGKRLQGTTGRHFQADIQRVEIAEGVCLWCIQPPCGGNIHVLTSGGEAIMVDTGFGIYREDLERLLLQLGILEGRRLKWILITHGDPDHAGAAGFFGAPVLMHRDTMGVLEKQDRAYASALEGSVLESVYTRLICRLSRLAPPRRDQVVLLGEREPGRRSIFPILERFAIGGVEFEVLGGLGGHLAGHLYLHSPSHGILFTGDTLINLPALSPERREFNMLAVNLILAVDVNRELAAMERRALLAIANEGSPAGGPGCLVGSGHGPLSRLEGDALVVCEPVVRIAPRTGETWPR